MKVVLFGNNGQVGWELHQLLHSSQNFFSFNRQQADFENPIKLKDILKEIRPHIIINAVAYTRVDQAESEREKAFLINTKAVRVLAECAKELSATLFHYSTDYVFDGTKNASYVESDQTCPLNIYGESKKESEEAIIQSQCKYFIFRTSWVYGQHGHNFIKTILQLAQQKESLSVVDDQRGTPTNAQFIANVTASLIKHVGNYRDIDAQGLYHLTSFGVTTWYDFAKFILEEAITLGMIFKMKPNAILPVTSEEYVTLAQRPKNSCLNTEKLTSTFDVTLRSWKEEASQTIKQLLSQRGER